MENPTPTSEHPPPPSGGPGPRAPRDEMLDLGRLRRSVTDRRIGGVAGGLARHLDVDPIILRVAFVVAVFFGGAGLLAYVGAWILVPEEGTDDEPLGLDRRSRTISLVGVGVLALLCAVGDWAGAFWFPWPLVIIAAIVLWFLNRHHPRDHAPVPASGQAPYARPAPYSGQASSAGPMPTVDYSRGPHTRNPRRRGPVLFFFTLALIVLGEGVLGVVDLAGADFSSSSYPALALALTAAMLLIGSFWGRAGGLIALGVVAALATAAATAGGHISQDTVTHAPTSASQVQDTYDLGAGDLLVDLSGVDDVEALDGREISIDSVGGRIEFIVPDGMDVAVRTEVVAGDSRVFDRRKEGFDVNLDGFRDGGPGVPDLTINIDLLAGEIIVREAA